jgi:hypothetical protein
MVRAPRLSAAILWSVTVALAVTGAWALGAPGSFFEGFPGGGHRWVAALPPYNEHLTRDVGSLSLGLAVLTASAALTVERRLVTVAALALLVWSTPHLVFHLGHLDGLAAGDRVGQLAALGLGVTLPLVLLGLAAAGRGGRRAR